MFQGMQVGLPCRFEAFASATCPHVRYIAKQSAGLFAHWETYSYEEFLQTADVTLAVVHFC